jgi:hypothetical protein
MKATNTCEIDGRLVIIGSHYTEPPVIGKGESVPLSEALPLPSSPGKTTKNVLLQLRQFGSTGIMLIGD